MHKWTVSLRRCALSDSLHKHTWNDTLSETPPAPAHNGPVENCSASCQVNLILGGCWHYGNELFNLRSVLIPSEHEKRPVWPFCLFSKEGIGLAKKFIQVLPHNVTEKLRLTFWPSQYITRTILDGLPWWLSSKESTCLHRRHGFSPRIGKIPWRRKWQPTPVLLLGESHGQRSLTGYSPWGHKGLDTTEQLNNNHHSGGTQEKLVHYTPLRLLDPQSVNEKA